MKSWLSGRSEVLVRQGKVLRSAKHCTLLEKVWLVLNVLTIV